MHGRVLFCVSVFLAMIAGNVLASDKCKLDYHCDDDNPCTLDACVGGECIHGLLPDDTPCNLGECVIDATCQGGECVGGTELVNGEPCDPGVSMENGRCIGGVCEGDIINLMPCETECVENGTCARGVCVGTDVEKYTPCDGDPCSTGEWCDAGACIGGTAVDCSTAGDECNDAACNPDGEEGNCELTPKPDGTHCLGHPCWLDEECQDGSCEHGADATYVDCSEAGDQCNDASCNPKGEEGNCDRIEPKDDGTPCEDGFYCSTDDECVSGVCEAGEVRPECVGPEGPAGPVGPAGPAGAAGGAGAPGADAQPGLSCWDLDGDGVGSPDEDINGDGNYDALDCRGEPGPPGADGRPGADGEPGAAGLPGAAGQSGTCCWDLDGNGIGTRDEDINGDGVYDAMDCQGVASIPGASGEPAGSSDDSQFPIDSVADGDGSDADGDREPTAGSGATERTGTGGGGGSGGACGAFGVGLLALPLLLLGRIVGRSRVARPR